MSIMSRLGLGRGRDADALEQRVSVLQTALQQCAEAAGKWRTHRRAVTASVAVLMLAVGFALGVYREPIGQFVADVAGVVGLASPKAESPYAAYEKRDYATALRVGRPLAEQGDANAQYVLGLLYYGGHGVPRDYARATKWYRLAAEQGNAQAQYSLGLFYAKGEAAPPDDVSAYMWLDLAAARLPASDSRSRGAMSSLDVLASRMAPEKIAEAQKRAREWRPSARTATND